MKTKTPMWTTTCNVCDHIDDVNAAAVVDDVSNETMNESDINVVDDVNDDKSEEPRAMSDESERPERP